MTTVMITNKTGTNRLEANTLVPVHAVAVG